MKDLTHLSLFSGIGGLDIAGEWAGFRTVGQCEWADYPRAVLEKHWPGLPRWRDIRTLTKESFYEQTGLGSVTVLSGGFPCQPFSTAGKRRGKEDDRYLWPEMLRVIQEIRPCWVVGENVAGIVSMALDTVLSDLEGIGYACQAVIIPACAVDAPHRRDRCAILANSSIGQTGSGNEREPGTPTLPQSDAGSASEGWSVAHSDSEQFQRDRADGEQVSDARCEERKPSRHSNDHVSDTDNGSWVVRRNGELSAVESVGSFRNDYRGRAPEYGGGEWWPAEPNVGRVAHGVPNRVDRLKCLGNAVVPQQFYPIFRAIAELEMQYT